MAKYNPFAEKAGMQKIAEQTPIPEVLKLADILRGLGFNLELLGSYCYDMRKLRDSRPTEEKKRICGRSLPTRLLSKIH